MKTSIAGCLFLLFLFAPLFAYAKDRSLWEEYKDRFITEDGRVIDYYQKQVSHSEGQGYGMLLALSYGDRTTFKQVWQWTKNNLKGRSDNLFPWQWGKRPNKKWGVLDYNNATDGDILIAYALLEASKKWSEKEFKIEALKVVYGIREKLSIDWKGKTLLLPAYAGFSKEDRHVLNPSYFIFPAFRSFADEDDKVFWDKVYSDSLSMAESSLFGKLNLPPDWIVLTEDGVSIFEEKGSFFGYEAVRTLLYVSWEQEPQYPEGLNKVLYMYEKLGYIPKMIDLGKDTFSLESSLAGYYAIYALAAKRIGRESLSNRLSEEARIKLENEKDNYYSFSLYLLANREDI